LVEIKKGKNITKDTIRDGTVPVVAGGIAPAYFHDTPNTQSPVITISASGANAGFVNLYYDDVWASDCSYIDTVATPHVFYYYSWLDYRRAAVTHLQRGSAQPHVYPKDLALLEALRAPDDLLNAFRSQIEPIFALSKRLTAKVDNLRRTRDLLLPRLLSGQIDVEAIAQ
jgi:type I restriction enzyme S subunit